MKETSEYSEIDKNKSTRFQVEEKNFNEKQ